MGHDIFERFDPDEGKEFGAGKALRRSWIDAGQEQKRRREVDFASRDPRQAPGNGSCCWPDVSIAEARDRASEALRHVRDGVDPILAKKAEARKFKRLTVAEAIEHCFAARQAELKYDGQAGRWLFPLSVHVIPKIGKTAIEDVDQHVLKQTLEPIWHEKADTARKAMNRMNLTFKHAAALGLDVALQAVMKAQALLGKRRHVTKHIPSLPYQEAPMFYRWLSGQGTVSAQAL